MKIKLLVTTASLALAAQASAAVLFADDFQTNLSQWHPGSGVIVAAPGGGNALAFSQNIGGGDLFAATPISNSSGHFHISFQYLGTCDRDQSCGGFLGFNNASGETWLAGSGPYPNPHPIVETGSWQTISFDFDSASPFTLKLEDWNGATDGPTPLNAYFRNLVVTGNVPEPATWGLMIAGFAMTGFAARRRRISFAA